MVLSTTSPHVWPFCWWARAHPWTVLKPFWEAFPAAEVMREYQSSQSPPQLSCRIKDSFHFKDKKKNDGQKNLVWFLLWFKFNMQQRPPPNSSTSCFLQSCLSSTHVPFHNQTKRTFFFFFHTGFDVILMSWENPRRNGIMDAFVQRWSGLCVRWLPVVLQHTSILQSNGGGVRRVGGRGRTRKAERYQIRSTLHNDCCLYLDFKARLSSDKKGTIKLEDSYTSEVSQCTINLSTQARFLVTWQEVTQAGNTCRRGRSCWDSNACV